MGMKTFLKEKAVTFLRHLETYQRSIGSKRVYKEYIPFTLGDPKLF